GACEMPPEGIGDLRGAFAMRTRGHGSPQQAVRSPQAARISTTSVVFRGFEPRAVMRAVAERSPRRRAATADQDPAQAFDIPPRSIGPDDLDGPVVLDDERAAMTRDELYRHDASAAAVSRLE